jgi:hypothetical protein
MYADSFVMDLLYSNDRQEQLAAPSAMVVLNVWMEVVQKVQYFEDCVDSFSLYLIQILLHFFCV